MPTSSDPSPSAAPIRRAIVFGLVLAAVSITVAPARAGAERHHDFDSLLPTAAPISDAELDQMRGRFVTAGQVMYFGIEMISEWTSAAGDNVTAGLNLAMDFSTQQPQVSYRPTIHVLNNDSADPFANPNGAASINNQGLTGNTGLGQIIQVTGDSNSIRNGFTLSINTGGRLVTEGPDAQPTSVEGLTGEVYAETGALGLRINMPGHGEVRQIMGSTGIQQSAAVWGHANQIRSQINLHMDFGQTDLLMDQRINPTNLTRGLPGQ